jgi:hypothetical protein
MRRMNDGQAFLCLCIFAAAVLAWGCEGGEAREVGKPDPRVADLCAAIGGDWGAYGREQHRAGNLRVVPDAIMQARIEAQKLGWLDGFTFIDAGVVWLSESLWERRDPERCAAVLLHELAHLRLHTLDEAKCDKVVSDWRANRG